MGNVVTSAALPFSASQFEKVARLGHYMHVPFIRKTTFQKYQNYLMFPFISKTTFQKYQIDLLLPVIIDAWETERQHMYQQEGT